MVYSQKNITLPTLLMFLVFFVIFFLLTACEGMYPKPEPVTYVLTASAGNHGTIEPKGEIVVNEGQDQAFTIIPDAGYKINEVIVNGNSIGIVDEYTFTNIKKDNTIEVKFKKKYTPPSTSSAPVNYTLRASAGDGGTIEPSGEIKVKKGDDQTFIITPDICHQIEKILVNETEVEEEIKAPYAYTFENIRQDCIIEVSFLLSDKKIRRYNLEEELQDDNYSSIQEAIEDASDGDVIIVCPGSYSENLIFSGNKNITVQSVEPENEDIVSATIIDGGVESSVVHFSNGDESTLQGFTITNGSGTSTGNYTAGGGIYINSSNPNILNNTIEDNKAANGAGIFITGNSSPEIKKNTIKNNESTNMAGGIYMFRGSANITDNIVSGNSTKKYGGGVYVYEGYEESVGGIANNIIENNKADYGGGIYLSKTSPLLESNDIKGNTANNDGGGIYLNISSPNIADKNIITENSANKGGGLYVEDSYNSITEKKINGNSITKNIASSAGGGIYLDNSMPTVEGSNMISENEAQWGGGIYITSSSPEINENSIIANSATGNSGSGGGIYMYNSSPRISNNIVSENTAVNCGGGIFIGDSYSVETDNNITGNSVESNSAKHGGGFYINNSNPIITGENLINCNTAINGGGFNIEVSSSPTITNNRITKNIATGNGGGINIKDSNPEIGGVDENDTDNFNIICSNNPEQIKTNTGTSYPFNDFGYCVTLSVNHVDYGTVTGEGDYCEGNLVQIEAIPAEGYYFINWTDDKGNEISIENPYSFTMPAEDINLIANFEIN